MKKTIYMFVLGILFLASSGLASAAWNTYPSDCPLPLSIGNYTTGDGIQNGSNGCWTKTNISASAGQTVNVAVYFDNTNGTDANNATISLTQSPAGSMSSKNSSYSFSGSLTSSAGSLYLSPVSVNLSSSETLTFSQAQLFKKGAQTGTSVSGYNAFSGGLSLGNITNSDWGTVIFSFSVGTTLAPQVCQDVSAPNYLGALPCTYPQLCKDTNATNYNSALPCTYPQLCKDTSALNYNGTLPCTYPQLCKDTSATNYNGALPCKYPAQLCKDTNATNYNGALPCTYPQLCKDTTANNYNSVLPCTYTVAKICAATLSANKTSITKGDDVKLTWGLTDCKNASLYPTVGAIYSSSSQTVYPTSSTLYTLTAYSSNGASVTRTVTVNVTEPVIVCQDSSASNYRSVGACVYPPQLCKDTSASNYNGALPCTYPPQLCKDPAASNYNGAIPCTYPPQLCKDTSALNFNGAIPCQYPVTERYCQDSNASNYRGLLPCVYPVRLCMDSGASNYRGTLPCEYPVRICTDSSASNYRSTGSCIYPQIRCLDTSASNYLSYSSCTYNNNNQVRCLDSSANNYLAYNNCTYNTQIRCLDTSASNYLSYSSCIYNQVRCTDASATNYLAYNSCIYNQVRCLDTSASNYLAYNSCLYNVALNKNVVTTVATNITSNQAQINGYITNTTYYNANVYFNYGTTVNLGSRTTSKVASGNSNFSDFISGLTPNTIYFFQAVGENNTGISKGNIEVFKTLSNGTVRPIIIQGTTIVGIASPVILNITNKYEVIGVGDLIDYIVTYKNVGKVILTRPMVQVILPTNVTLVNASRGTYSVDNHTLSAPIGDLLSGEEGVIYLQGKVDSIPLNNAQIATTAILVYTSPNGVQENAMAYVLNIPKLVGGVVTEGSVLGASVFSAGFMSIGLIGWLLIILLIMLIILIAKSYSRNNTSTDSKTITHTTTH